MYMNGCEASTPTDQDESPPDIAASSSDCTCLRSCAPPIARPGPVSCWVERQSALPDHSSCQSIGRNACGVERTSNGDHRSREACHLESGHPWLREHAMPLALRSVRLQNQISRSRSSAGAAGPRTAPAFASFMSITYRRYECSDSLDFHPSESRVPVTMLFNS